MKCLMMLNRCYAKWTSHMTGLVYPVGVIPEISMVHKHKHRIEEAFLVFLKKEDFVRGNDLKIGNILGIDFSMTG